MKLHLSLAALSFSPFAAVLAAEPAVSAEQAAKIASDTLKERNLTGQHWITGLTLEPTSPGKRETVWVVRWNEPISLEQTKRETGLEIAMDGTYARYIDKTAVTPATAGIPGSRAALSNHRTRSDRPSILSLKH